MEDSKKKTMMIGIVVVCLVAAVAITLSRTSKKTGLAAIERGSTVWVKCTNPDCEAEYQTDKKEFYKEVKKAGPITCKECGEPTLVRAVKCEKCGVVFPYGAVGPGDFGDRCPECGYSKVEEGRKNR